MSVFEDSLRKGSNCPIAITSGNKRPLTNKDPRNNAPQKFGLPRPLKWQYRQGVSFHPKIMDVNPENPYEYIDTSQVSHAINPKLVGLTIDQPGRYSNSTNESSNCNGVSLVTSFTPEKNLTNNPEPISTNPIFCCNKEKNAKKMVIYASTNLKSNYYNSNFQYLQNRCQTYQQKSFNFTNEENSNKSTSPLLSNT
jgi:hypothetical protein